MAKGISIGYLAVILGLSSIGESTSISARLPSRLTDTHAFLLTSVPEDEASDFMCQPRHSATSKGPANSRNGPYFGTFFKIIEPGEEPAGLGFLWAKESGDWKVVTFQMDEP